MLKLFPKSIILLSLLIAVKFMTTSCSNHQASESEQEKCAEVLQFVNKNKNSLTINIVDSNNRIRKTQGPEVVNEVTELLKLYSKGVEAQNPKEKTLNKISYLQVVIIVENKHGDSHEVSFFPLSGYPVRIDDTFIKLEENDRKKVRSIFEQIWLKNGWRFGRLEEKFCQIELRLSLG